MDINDNSSATYKYAQIGVHYDNEEDNKSYIELRSNNSYSGYIAFGTGIDSLSNTMYLKQDNGDSYYFHSHSDYDSFIYPTVVKTSLDSSGSGPAAQKIISSDRVYNITDNGGIQTITLYPSNFKEGHVAVLNYLNSSITNTFIFSPGASGSPVTIKYAEGASSFAGKYTSHAIMYLGNNTFFINCLKYES